MGKWRSGCLKCFLVLFAIFVIWLCFNFTGGGVRKGKSVVRISTETTILTGPLDANGDVDYLAAINEMLSEGVTPENNALVAILRTTGPSPSGLQLSEEFFEKLGIEPLPVSGDYFVSPSDWFVSQDPDFEYDPMDFESSPEREMVMQRDYALRHPWSGATFVDLEKWLIDQDDHLDALRKASELPRFYQPMISNDTKFRMIGTLLPAVQSTREIARNLATRAMYNLEKGEFEEFRQDVLAMHRLSRLVAQGNTLIEQLVAIAIDGIANNCVIAAIDAKKLDKQQLLKMRDDLNGLKRQDGFVRALEKGERYMMNDTLQSIARHGTDGIAQISGRPQSVISKAIGNVVFGAIDWEEAFKVANETSESIVNRANAPFGERAQALQNFEEEMKALEVETSNPANVIMTVLGGRKAKGRLAGNFMVCLMTPAVIQVSHAFDRINTDLDMLVLELSINAYQSEHGEFPETLEDLVPSFAAKIPVDSFNKLPFAYSRTEDGYSLYSFDSNGIDNGGEDAQGPRGDHFLNHQLQDWDEFVQGY